MIQRKQTLYLLVVTILMGLCSCLPLCACLSGTRELSLSAFNLNEISQGVPPQKIVGTFGMGVTFVIAALLALVTIFLYKNRFVQVRFAIVEIVLLVGAVIFEVYYIIYTYKILDATAMRFHFAATFPLIAIIFDYLAVRGILRDQNLVRSLDRIR